MENSKFTDLLKQYKARMAEGITPLSDEDVAQGSGGVGGADEATCPYCTGSVAMNKINNPTEIPSGPARSAAWTSISPTPKPSRSSVPWRPRIIPASSTPPGGPWSNKRQRKKLDG